MKKIPRNKIAQFLNTGTSLSPVWSIIGSGVASAAVEYNPTVEEAQYIHQTSASKSLENYAPKVPLEQVAKKGEPVFEFIDALFIDRSVLGDAEAEVCNVWLYDTTVSGWYKAERQAVSISLEKKGGANVTKINYTLNYNGDPVFGVFDPAGLEFVPSPTLAGLATLNLDSAVLAPAFVKDILLYSATTASATDDITAVAETAGATVDIDVNGDTVLSGAPATWDEGENIVTITVTSGGEPAIYRISVIYTPEA